MEWMAMVQKFCIYLQLLVPQSCRHFLPMPLCSYLQCDISVSKKQLSLDVTVVFLIYMDKLAYRNSDSNKEVMR